MVLRSVEKRVYGLLGKIEVIDVLGKYDALDLGKALFDDFGSV